MKVKTTIHWVEQSSAVNAEVRLYDRLFNVPEPNSGEEDFKSLINEQSLITVTNACVEPSLKDAVHETRYQFIRKGYFCLDVDSENDKLVFNRIVSLKDSWAKISEKG